MRRYATLLLFLMIIAEQLRAQDKTEIPASGKNITDFIPKGYDTLATASGDLNKDKLADLVLVLRPDAEDATDGDAEAPDRILLILFRDADGYRLTGRSDKVIMCKECGGIFGDPFAGIVIAKGVLVIDHYGGSNWRWSYTHRFRYQQGDFYLVGQTSNSYWNVAMCEKLDDFAGRKYKDENLITGAYEQKEISEEGCKLLVNKKGKQKILPLVKLSAFNLEN